MASSNAARDRLSKALEDAQEQIQHIHLTSQTTPSSSTDRIEQTSPSLIKEKSNKDMISMKGFGETWNNVMDATKSTLTATKKVLGEEIQHFQIPSIGGNGVVRERDISMPLDAVALQDTEVVYITDRIITMRHPAVQSDTNGDLTANRKLAAVSHLLKKRHGGHFMVWNLSELEYETSVLNDQVLTFKFPGSPSPPLGLLIKILMSLDSWLKADTKNVAILHCLTGKGRTSIITAAFLCWSGECGFHTMNDALAYIASCKRYNVDDLVIPSQRRYLSYVSNMLDGVRPHRPPIILKRITMSDAPSFESVPLNEAVGFITNKEGPSFEPMSAGTGGKDGQVERDDSQLNLKGCAPYMQVFKSGKLLYTSCLSSDTENDESNSIPWCVTSTSEQGATKRQQLTFAIEAIIQGDILIRCRHLTRSGQRVSMFRVALHTGYIVAPRVLRLTKAEIDGACIDPRIPTDFYLDFVFEPCDANIASAFLNESNLDGNDLINKRVLSLKSSNDTMIYDDGAVWESITRRQKEISSTNNNSSLKRVGSTIGRIRDITKAKQARSEEGVHLSDIADASNCKTKSNTISEAFSIGGHYEMGFEEEITFNDDSKKLLERDELMEALNAIESPEGKVSKLNSKESLVVQTTEHELAVPEGTDIVNSPNDDTVKLVTDDRIDNDFDFDFEMEDGYDELIELSDDDQSLNDLEDFLVRQS